MIANRLVEAVLFLESQSHNEADKEYISAIRRMIEEHAMLRETLDAILTTKDINDAPEMARAALAQTAQNTFEDNIALRQSLVNLSRLLPTDEQLQAILRAKSLIYQVLK
ncbi:MAG: hypothetical protein Q9M19_00265 [Mariprofundaceae bacterium]|nr:hypothetical protein [Mariprofundaceae bacterium]